MKEYKYVSSTLDEIYIKKYIQVNDIRVKSINIISIVDTFLDRYINYNKDNINLSSKILKKVYGNTYSKCLTYLIEHNFIYLYKNYQVGNKSNCYRLTKTTKESITNYTLIDFPCELKFKLNTQFKEQTVYYEVIQQLTGNLYDVKLNYNCAKNWIDTNIELNTNAYLKNLSTIKKIHNKDIYHKLDRYGRFHTNFTNLKREIRQSCLTIDGQKLNELDISNSQPLFLYLLMKNQGFNEFTNFDKDVLNGEIYENIQIITGEERKVVKKKIYSVLFGRTNNNYWSQVFSELYPNVYNWLVEYKKENNSYKIIARELQMMESEFMYNNLIPKIYSYSNNIKLITIHDSIMFTENNYTEIKKIFNKCKMNLL